MQFRSGGALLVGAGVFFSVTSARAEQFIVTDVTYTHSKDTTTDSHYRVSPSAATPKDWTKPTDWSKGSVHVLLEVKTKPGDTPTKFQICFEGNPSYACTYQSDTYTRTGTLQWSTPFSGMWSPEGKPMNWANGVGKVALILKDTNNGKPQGDPKYVPTDLHVEVAVVSAGDTYKPPTAAPKDAGVVDAAIRDASVVDAAGIEEPIEDAGSAPADAAIVTRRDASATVSTLDSGRPASDDDEEPEVDASVSPATASSDSGCALGGAGSQGWLALLGLALRRRRRTR